MNEPSFLNLHRSENSSIVDWHFFEKHSWLILLESIFFAINDPFWSGASPPRDPVPARNSPESSVLPTADKYEKYQIGDAINKRARSKNSKSAEKERKPSARDWTIAENSPGNSD
jgi:hypothetical protein